MARIDELKRLAGKALGGELGDNTEPDLSAYLMMAIELDIGLEISGAGVAAVFLHPKRRQLTHYREDPRVQGKSMAVRMALLRAAAEIGRFK